MLKYIAEFLEKVSDKFDDQADYIERIFNNLFKILSILTLAFGILFLFAVLFVLFLRLFF